MFVLFDLSANGWRDQNIHGLFVFPPKKTLIRSRPCSIGQSCYSMTSKWSISWFLESSRAWSFFTWAFAKSQSNRSISVCLLFLFCSRVFTLRSYENRSITFPVQASCMQCSPSSSTVAIGTLTGHIYFVEITNVEKPRLIYRSHFHNGPVLQLRCAVYIHSMWYHYLKMLHWHQFGDDLISNPWPK